MERLICLLLVLFTTNVNAQRLETSDYHPYVEFLNEACLQKPNSGQVIEVKLPREWKFKEIRILLEYKQQGGHTIWYSTNSYLPYFSIPLKYPGVYEMKYEISYVYRNENYLSYNTHFYVREKCKNN